ncbi:MAG: hypothetical protein ACFFAJ_10650 [Candidatus Hodarchaeota archaeon]
MSKTRYKVINMIENIDQFIIIIRFIENSILFTIEKFTELVEAGRIKKNSFHIRKVLRTLKDRAKHLKIVSENIATQGNTLVSRLDLSGSEIPFEIQKKNREDCVYNWFNRDYSSFYCDFPTSFILIPNY